MKEKILRFHLALVLIVLALACGSAVAAEPQAARPNIVVIVGDDLGYGDVQRLNPKRGRIPTPNLDQIAAQGLTFTDAHSGSSVCTPTRYGLLTGRYAWRTRLQAGVFGDYVAPLIAPDRLTLGGLLRRRGYHTACIGKWHLGFTLEGEGKDAKDGAAKIGARIVGGPTTRGFDYYFGFSRAKVIQTLIENDQVIETIEPVEMLPRLTRRAVAFIGERAADAKAGRPFFLYLPLSSPHLPIVPAAEWQGKSDLGAYGDFVMQTDAAVGAVTRALDDHGLARNTLLILTSDNGCSPHAGVEKLEANGHFPSAGFRGYKSDIWEGGHRVPFLVRWPGVVKAGSASRQLICLTDLMATVADILGFKLPDNAGEDSVSILPALKGTDRAPLRDAVVHHSINGAFAIRQGTWKLSLCPGSGGWSHPNDGEAARQGLPALQLYDLSADVAEQKNLQADQPAVVEKMMALLRRYVADGRSTPGKAQKNDVSVRLQAGEQGAQAAPKVADHLMRVLKDISYFPPPDSKGGWRTLRDADEIRRVAGMDKQKLDEAFEFIKASTKSGGLLVLRKGWLVYEDYFGLGHRDATPNLASVGKSFTSIAVGILLDQRPKLFPDGLNQKVFTPDYLPPEAFPLTDPRKNDIKLGQLLAMTAGIRGNNPVYVLGKEQTIDPAGPDGWPSSLDEVAFGKQEGVYQGRPYSTKTLWRNPGEGYSYASSSIHLASVVLRHVTGMELQQYVDKHLAQPMGWGAWGYAYRNAPGANKHTPGGGGIAARATDMLRFGYLLLNEGRWNDRRLVPAEYVRHCARTSPYNPHYPYSLQFDVNTGGAIPELPRDAFWKSGSGGHALYVVPSLDLVVWKLGGRDEQYAPDNTGLPASPASQEQVAARKGWKETVDKETALRKTLQMAVGAITRKNRFWSNHRRGRQSHNPGGAKIRF